VAAGYLKTLTIERLRGSTRSFKLPFGKGKKLTIIYGENGTGKSTICDALDFLGNGQVGSLATRGLGSTYKYWPAIGRNSEDMKVCLEGSTGSCTAQLAHRSVVVDAPEQRPGVLVLRRPQILSLVEAKPAERYEAIRRFIDVAGVEGSEKNLSSLLRTLNDERRLATERVTENQNTITDFWRSEGAASGDPIDWARTAVQRDPEKLQTERLAVASLRSSYGRLVGFPDRLRAAQQGLANATSAMQQHEAALEAVLDQVEAGAEDLSDLLHAAQRYLGTHPDLRECPLCESAEKIEGLSARVASRIHQFVALKEARSSKKQAVDQLPRWKAQLNAVGEEWGRERERYLEVLRGEAWPADVPVPDALCPVDISDSEAWLETMAPMREGWAQAEAKRIDQSRFIEQLQRALNNYDSNVEKHTALDAILPRLEEALAIVQDERRRFTDGILSDIATRVGSLYEQIHPGEGLERISLQLDQRKRASLELASEYQGRDGLPPQAYFSDSHLDTLGLCIFLAVAEKENPEDTILVLDDVLGSVDEPHVDRVIEMLYQRARHFRHCLIMTHYGPWRHKLRWGWLKNDQCHFLELRKSSGDDGLSLSTSVPDTERLRDLLAADAPDVQLICAKAGVALEAALDFLTSLYQCAVPRRPDGRFTLGDLLPAVDKKLRKALMVDVLVERDASGEPRYQSVELGPILDELTRIAQARNIFGAHFNELAFHLPEGDALAFGQRALDLLGHLACPDAGWPRRNKSGSYWSNAGETRRLYPLQRPS